MKREWCASLPCRGVDKARAGGPVASRLCDVAKRLRDFQSVLQAIPGTERCQTCCGAGGRICCEADRARPKAERRSTDRAFARRVQIGCVYQFCHAIFVHFQTAVYSVLGSGRTGDDVSSVQQVPRRVKLGAVEM